MTMVGAKERQDGAAASTVHATPARLPCIEGFFCKILPDTNLLRRTIESVRNADACDKDENLKELESLLSDTGRSSTRTKRRRSSECCSIVVENLK